MATFEKDEPIEAADRPMQTENGGVATAVWAPPEPTLAVAADMLDLDEYEVRVYDMDRNRRLGPFEK